MKTYLYLNILPEALIASQLPPETFGSYLAVGTRKRSRGQAMFFEVNPDFKHPELDLQNLERLCEPRPDGSPRHSSYLSIYRVFETVPLSHLGKLWLVTDDGRVLSIPSAEYSPEPGRKFHLYQEFAPVRPRVVSLLEPRDFATMMTTSGKPIHVPCLVFADMRLEHLAEDPEHPDTENLPYANIEHLRDCLRELSGKPSKPTKTVLRYLQGDFLFRTIRKGFYICNEEEFRFYPMPSLSELETTHYLWWRSALATFGQ